MTEPALVANTVDPEQVENAKRKEKRGAERDLDDVRWVLSDPRGRRFYWRLMGHCSTFKSIIGTDAHMTYANAGRQDVGHFLLEQIELARPEALLEMQLAERKEKENRVPAKKPKENPIDE